MTSMEMINAEKETELKKKSSKSKSSFTLYRNRLLLLIEEQDVLRNRIEQRMQENGFVHGIVDGGNVSVVRYFHEK